MPLGPLLPALINNVSRIEILYLGLDCLHVLPLGAKDVLDNANRSVMRWTVDYPEDLEFVRAVFRGLHIPGKIFSQADILGFLAQHPEIVNMNAHVGK